MFGFVLARVDAVHRAHVHTGGVLGADARFGDYISHSASPLFRAPDVAFAALQQNLRVQGRFDDP